MFTVSGEVQTMTIDEWENIYTRFEEEMTMFGNIVSLAKNLPDEGGPEIEGCSPEQYRPMLQAFVRIYETIKRLEQEPGKRISPSTDPSPLNDKIKSFAKQLNIHLVGFTKLKEAWVFPPSEKWTYPQAYREIKHQNVISLGMEMSCEVFNINHFPDNESLFEAINVYAKLGEAIDEIAEYIREQGFEATGHHPYAGNFLYSAHAVKAGIGSLGANGIVLTDLYGPRQRFGAITTNAPLELTGPSENSFDKFCLRCMRCVKTCPTKALSSDKINCDGVYKWKINNNKCWPYFIANNGCGVCMLVCPLNKKNTGFNRLLSKRIRKSSLLAELLLKIDDAFIWKPSLINRREDRMKPVEGPMSFKNMLKKFGKKENQC
jgi:ferredoxin